MYERANEWRGERENERRRKKKKRKKCCEKRSQRCRRSGTFSWQALHSQHKVCMLQSRFVSRTVLIITAHADHHYYPHYYFYFDFSSEVRCIRSALRILCEFVSFCCNGHKFRFIGIRSFHTAIDHISNSTKSCFLFSCFYRTEPVEKCFRTQSAIHYKHRNDEF